MASVSPSNHQTTAAKLTHAGITLKEIQLEEPLDFDTEWTRFASLCGSTETAAAAWTKLEESISASYSGELEFDRRLYGDIMALLGASVRRVSDNLYLLNGTRTIGIARQVHRENHLGFPTDYGLTTDAIHYHAVVLVNQRDIIVDETSLVELKTDESNCHMFPVRRGKVFAANLSKEHGALGQALIYTAGDLINCLARRGTVEEHLEILVLSGKKQNRTRSQQRLCYVRSRLNIPQYCGEPFSFSVLDFKSYDDRDAEKHGLAAYFNTISNGIERARRAAARPVPLCGRSPRVVDCIIPLNLVGSPIPGANLELTVSQGEIFRARLSDVLPAEHLEMLWMINNSNMLQQIRQNRATDETVLVKFGCQSVHHHFVPPHAAYSALERMHSREDTRAALSSVLLGVWEINALSVVTITRELQDFGPVKPVELTQPGEMRNLWNGFVALVAEVLIPMANMGVVYADMRPGWSVTSNILRRRLQDGTDELKLIDYESVCKVTNVPEDVGRKTFRAAYDDTADNVDYTASRHLWWQCVFTAYMWAMQLDVAGTLDCSTFVEDFQSGNLGGQFWGTVDGNEAAAIVNQKIITGPMVLRTLQILSGVPGLST